MIGFESPPAAPAVKATLSQTSARELESRAKVQSLSMPDHTRVRVLDFDYDPAREKPSLLLIPGLGTVFDSWAEAVRLLSPDFRIFYFESREKSSSVMADRVTERGITLHAMALDLPEVVKQLALPDDQYWVLASSTGCTILMEALGCGWMKPAGAILVGPMTRHRISRTAAFLTAWTPEPLKDLAMPFFRVYLHWVYANRRRHPEQYVKYLRAAEEVRLRKISPVLKEMTRHDATAFLSRIETPCRVVAASSDSMHLLSESQRIVRLLRRGSLVDVGTNKAAHGQPLIDAVCSFVTEIRATGTGPSCQVTMSGRPKVGAMP
jgi:alpha-beta hydrolase superfamily lysophospholipase